MGARTSRSGLAAKDSFGVRRSGIAPSAGTPDEFPLRGDKSLWDVGQLRDEARSETGTFGTAVDTATRSRLSRVRSVRFRVPALTRVPAAPRRLGVGVVASPW